MQIRAQHQVLEDGEIGENHAAFGDVGDAELDDLVRGQVGDIPALIQHLAAPRRQQTGDGTQRGRFARAIRADQRDDVAGAAPPKK